MELKQLCKTLDIDRADDWSTAKSLATCAYLENGSKVDPHTIYAALSGTQVIEMKDRQGIMAGITHAKRVTGWKQIPVTMGMVDWKEAPDTRTYNEKVADWQQQQHYNFTNAVSGHTKTRADYNREERARRAYYSL